MPYYECSIRGAHFPAELIGKKGMCGFNTTRWLEADDSDDAEMKVVQMLRGERSFQWRGKPERMADARIFVETIREIKKLPKSQGGGATWYTE